MDEVRAASVRSDRHTIILAVDDFLGTLAYFVGTPFTPNTPSRRVKRSVARHKRRRNYNMTFMFFGSMGWMVLVGSISIPTAAFQGPAHPFSMVTMKIKGAYTRIQRLDEAVDLSPLTFVQYQSLEAKKLWKEFAIEEKKNGLEGHGCSLEIDESEFFDAYKTYQYTARSSLTASRNVNLKIMRIVPGAIFGS
jgi:hypothetical protein